MIGNLSPELAVYFEILLTLAALGGAFLLHAALKRVLVRAGADSVAAFLLGRITLPLALLAVVALLRAPAVRALLDLRDAYVDFQRALFLFFVVMLIVRLADAAFRGWHRRRGRTVVLPRVLHGFILAVVYIAVFLAVFRNFLGDLRPYLAGSAILTAIIGLALQGVLGNILSGMSLHFTRAFSQGDWVKIGDVEGVVMDTNWRETRVLDRYSNMIVLPNNVVAAAVVTNFSQPDARAALTLPVKAGFDAPAAVVLDCLKAAARENPLVVDDPPPTAFLVSYDEFGVTYTAKFWIADYSRKHTAMTEVGRLIWSKFRRHGIEVPMPLADGLGRVMAAVRPEAVRAVGEAAGRDGNFRDLAASALLKIRDGERAGETALSEEDLRELAARARRVRFGRGEVLFRQGETGESCYVVARGRVHGRIAYDENGREYASEFDLGPGGLIGEMSLFTGLPRTATAVVAEDAELLEIGADAFARVLDRNPALAEAVADIVSARNRENLESLAKIKELAAGQAERSADRKSILEHLRRLARRWVGGGS